MFKRYDLMVYYLDAPVYNAAFSSINQLVKFACGFDRNVCKLEALDIVFEKFLPIEDLCKEFEVDTNGI